MGNRTLVIVTLLCVLSAGCSKSKTSGGIKLSKIYAGGQLQVEYNYNPDGQLKSELLYGFPSRKTSEITCYYDASGKLVKKESAYDFSSGVNPVWSYSHTDYTFGTDGSIIEEKNYLKQNNADVLTSKIKPGYDAAGKQISRRMFLPNDQLIRLTTYQYNNSGNITLQEEFHYSGTTANLEYRYSYDNYDNKRNPYFGLMSGVPPFSVNINNILKTTVTNFVQIPGTPVTTTQTTVFNSYNRAGLPVNIVENGTSFVFEYR